MRISDWSSDVCSSDLPVTTERQFGPEWTVDLTASARIGDAFEFGGGVLNLFDAYADKVAERALTQGGSLPYPEAGGLGFRGREIGRAACRERGWKDV